MEFPAEFVDKNGKPLQIGDTIHLEARVMNYLGNMQEAGLKIVALEFRNKDATYIETIAFRPDVLEKV